VSEDLKTGSEVQMVTFFIISFMVKDYQKVDQQA